MWQIDTNNCIYPCSHNIDQSLCKIFFTVTKTLTSHFKIRKLNGRHSCRISQTCSPHIPSSHKIDINMYCLSKIQQLVAIYIRGSMKDISRSVCIREQNSESLQHGSLWYLEKKLDSCIVLWSNKNIMLIASSWFHQQFDEAANAITC